MQNNNPQVNVTIDRTRAAAFGVTADQIESTLYDAYGSRQVSTIFTPSNEYQVIIELLPQYQQDLSALGAVVREAHDRHTRADQGGGDARARASVR